jgi:hypothetical protein
MEQAWQSFVAGTMPVSAVVADPAAVVVAEGRGRRFERAVGGRQLAYCHIAHVNIKALALLPPVHSTGTIGYSRTARSSFTSDSSTARTAEVSPMLARSPTSALMCSPSSSGSRESQ